MSEVHAAQAPEANVAKLGPAGLLIGVPLLGVSIGLMYLAPDQRVEMAQSYLFGWVFWAALTLGCFGLTLLHHTVRGSWGLSILRMLEAGGGPRALSLMALLFLPVVGMYGVLYPWADKARVAADTILQHKSGWINPQMVTGRTFVLFAIWALAAAWLRRSSARQDESGDETEAQKRTNFAAPGIVFFVITVTLAVTDWVMSLDAHWYSTMFGPLFVVGPALGALALCTLIVCVNADKSPFNQIMSLSLTKDLGNMLFTLNLFWAYFNFSQFIIYWNGNLPTPAGYYFHRSADGWNFIGGFLIVFQFLVPFFALMTPRIKASPRALAWVCGWLILMRFLDVYYIVTPMYRTTGPMVHWQDIVALLGVGGIWLAAFGSQVKGASVYPVHDMRLMEAVEHA